MKRRIFIVGGLALAVASCYVANLLAQPAAGGGATVKIAVMNIDAVFSKYNKANEYKNELDKMIQPFKGEAEKIKKSIIDIQTYLKQPDAKDKDKYERGVLDYRRKLEDLDREVRELIGKKQEDQLCILYKDVVAASKLYAEANGIGMVFGFGEPTENADPNLKQNADPYSFPNISRKLRGMGLGAVPIWTPASLDITDPIIQTLNYNYKK